MLCNITKFFHWYANAVNALWKLTRLNNPKVLYGFFSGLYKRNVMAAQERFRAFDDLIDRVRKEYETDLVDVQFAPYGPLNMIVEDLGKENEEKISVMLEHKTEGVHIPCTKGPSLKLIQLFFGKIPTFIREYDENCNIKLIDERGPILTFSQSPTGHISIFVFFARSDYITPPEEGLKRPVIYLFQRDPTKIDTKTIRRAIRFFLSVANTSSCFGTNTIWQHLYLWWRKGMLFFQTFNHKQLLEFIKFVIENVPHP